MAQYNLEKARWVRCCWIGARLKRCSDSKSPEFYQFQSMQSCTRCTSEKASLAPASQLHLNCNAPGLDLFSALRKGKKCDIVPTDATLKLIKEAGPGSASALGTTLQGS